MNKDKAIHFLELIIAGKIDEAYELYIEVDGKHHNMYTPAGFGSLQEGMQAAEEQTPNKQFKIRNVFGDNELIAVHSHLIMKPSEPGMATVHMFRFENGKIVEMWDIAQTIPLDMPNNDGPF
jgi:predicted SnoaL-like aldol condensation-catalyzing enzyme